MVWKELRKKRLRDPGRILTGLVYYFFAEAMTAEDMLGAPDRE
jgi:hypothetical protein